MWRWYSHCVDCLQQASTTECTVRRECVYVWNWTVECLQHLDLMYSCNTQAFLDCIANGLLPFFTWTDIGTADGLMMQLKVVSSIVCFSWFVHCSEYAVSSCLAHYLQSIKYNKNWIGTETEKQSKLKLQLNSNYF